MNLLRIKFVEANYVKLQQCCKEKQINNVINLILIPNIARKTIDNIYDQNNIAVNYV